ncbi:MAG: hypothetical protein IJT77_12500, partial [Clostridia bacterium]|nr:hypothetical protein [Clostridia bacterium]
LNERKYSESRKPKGRFTSPKSDILGKWQFFFEKPHKPQNGFDHALDGAIICAEDHCGLWGLKA